MNLTNEQIQVILDGAPKGTIAIGIDGYVNSSAVAHRLSDLREILTLRQEVERLKNAILQIGSAKTFGDAENKLTYAESLCQ